MFEGKAVFERVEHAALVGLVLMAGIAAFAGCDDGAGKGGPRIYSPGRDAGMEDLGREDLGREDLGAGDLGVEDGGGGDPGPVPGCAPVVDALPRPVRMLDDPDGPFFARPFPDDSRTDELGHPVLDGFPNPGNSALVDQVVALVHEHCDGWATNGTMYLAFDGPLHPDSLPRSPEATLARDATVYLAELTPSGQEVRRIPLMVGYREDQTLFLPPHTVAAYPVPGFPLAGAARHVFVVTTGALDASCRPLPEIRGEARARLEEAGIDPTGVAAAALFTTQDVIGKMRALARVVDSLEVPRCNDWVHAHGNRYYDVYEGTVPVPGFQAGEPPYLTPDDGGSIVWEDGVPQVQRMERVRISLSVPKGDPPTKGWPIAIYAHGTGGDFESVLNGPAGELATRGIAALGYDQVLHGPRDPTGSSPELTFFNVMNMIAGRDNVLQGGVDGLTMLRFVRFLILPRQVTVDNEPVIFDRSHVLFIGHSQGGITGAPFVAVADQLDAALFSGTSGLLTITVMERPGLEISMLPGVETYKELVEVLLNISGREEIDMFHPALAVMQTFIEPADTINYAPYFHLADPDRRIPILVLEGFLDDNAPAHGIEAFAVAAGADLVAPVGRSVPGLELLGRSPLEPPVTGNWDGITAGLSQYPENGHFPLFVNPSAAARAYGFLQSALGPGQPTIE